MIHVRPSLLLPTLALLVAASCSSPSGAPAAPAGSGAPGVAGTAASGAPPASGGAAASSSGAAGQATSGGAAASTAGAGGAGGAGATSVAGNAGNAGNAGASSLAGAAGAGSSGTDTPAPRELNTDHTGFRENTFSAQSLDPEATQGHAGSTQYAAVNTAVALQKKLCIVLTDKGTPPGIATADWMYDHGFHVLQIAYQNELAMAPDGDENPDTPGSTRLDQFDAKGRVQWVKIKRADSIEERTLRALKFLKTKDPGGDWGWFLNADDTIRWSDGCFIGYAYGGTLAAVVARYVRLGHVVSTSAPEAEGHPNASWLKAPSATPLERVFSLYGMNDTPAAAGRFDATTAALGYLGEVAHAGLTDQPSASNPYGGSHRIELNGQGKGIFCAAGADYPPCLYSFGLPLQ
jgi:hypothetical protein